MATNLQTDSGPSVGGLVSGIVGDAQELINQQFRLFKEEVREDFRKSREAAAALALSGVVLLVGVLLLSLSLVHLLAWLTAWPDWVCNAVVGTVITALGAGLGYQGWQTLRSIRPLQDETAKAIEENLEWKTKPT